MAKPPATDSPDSTLQVYSQEQVQEILNVAIASQSYDGEFSREQLFEIADELGISRQCLTGAEQSWLVHQSESRLRLSFDTYRQGELKAKLSRFGVASTGLLAISALSQFAILWPLYIVCALTARIALQAWTVYQQNEDAYERAFRRWLRNRQLSQFVNRWWSRILSF